jgi:hypothetical protein
MINAKLTPQNNMQAIQFEETGRAGVDDEIFAVI